jgi:hypothetical protein
MSAIKRLDELDAEVRRAEARVRELELERAKVGRAHDRALAPLADYHRALGAGEAEPDPERESGLERELDAATRHLTRRPIVTNGRISDWAWSDPRLDARAEGATDARDAAERERDGYLDAHRADLVAEALPALEAAAGELADRYEAAAEAEGPYRDALRVLERFGSVADRAPDPPRVDGREVAAIRRLAERGLLRPEEVV